MNHCGTREEWLTAALEWLTRHARQNGYDMPGNIRVSCGLPSKGAFAARRQRIGECWAPLASEDSHAEIFISPVIDEPAEVLAVLVHEAIHAIVGHKAGHRGAFKRCATALGLVGPMTATSAGPGLQERLEMLASELGRYPHARLNGMTNGRKKVGTRLLKAACPQCGYTVRVTAKWLAVGNPVCPCGQELVAELAATRPRRP